MTASLTTYACGLGCALALSSALAQRPPELLITLQLTGGIHVGSYELSQANAACLHGSGGGDDWRLLYAEDRRDPEAVSTLLLLLPDPSEGSQPFLSIGFGDEDSDDAFEYVLDPGSGNGTGTATIERDGRKRALIRVAGETASGVSINATITCNEVLSVNEEAGVSDLLATLDFGPGETNAAAVTGSFSLKVGGRAYDLQTNDDQAFCEPLTNESDLLYSYDPGGGYTSLEVYFPSLEEALSGTSEFALGFDLQPVYRPSEGSGTARANQVGDRLTIVLEVQTADGTEVAASLDCVLLDMWE